MRTKRDTGCTSHKITNPAFDKLILKCKSPIAIKVDLKFICQFVKNVPSRPASALLMVLIYALILICSKHMLEELF